LLTKIKIHSAYKNIFSQSEYTADLTRYGDLPFYLGSMHPKFRNYAYAIHTGDCQEGYSLLDKSLTVVEEEDLYIKKIKSQLKMALYLSCLQFLKTNLKFVPCFLLIDLCYFANYLLDIL